MMKAATPSLLKSDPAALRGRPVTNIPVVRSVKAIPAHPILLARNMTSPHFSADPGDVSFIRTQQVVVFTFMKTTALFGHKHIRSFAVSILCRMAHVVSHGTDFPKSGPPGLSGFSIVGYFRKHFACA
jgi:hypothetical protein